MGSSTNLASQVVGSNGDERGLPRKGTDGQGIYSMSFIAGTWTAISEDATRPHNAGWCDSVSQRGNNGAMHRTTQTDQEHPLGWGQGAEKDTRDGAEGPMSRAQHKWGAGGAWIGVHGVEHWVYVGVRA